MPSLNYNTMYSHIAGTKRPADAAKKLHRYVRELCVAMGMNPDVECWVKSPEETAKQGRYGKQWTIGWDAGPHEWAIILAGVQDHNDASQQWYLEPYNGHVLTFAKK